MKKQVYWAIVYRDKDSSRIHTTQILALTKKECLERFERETGMTFEQRMNLGNSPTFNDEIMCVKVNIHVCKAQDDALSIFVDAIPDSIRDL